MPTEHEIVPLDYAVTPDAKRPNSVDDSCFYCHQAIGEPHRPSCVLIAKKVRVRMTVEYEVEVPASWNAGDVEFHRNESSWCADNAMGELEKLAGREGCLCGVTHFEFVGTTSGPFRNERG